MQGSGNSTWSLSASTLLEIEAMEQKLMQKQNECLSFAQERVSLADENYDVLETQIRALDKTLNLYEIKLRKDADQYEVTQAPVNRRKVRKRKLDPEAMEYRLRLQKELAQEIQKQSKVDIPVDPGEPVYCVCQKVSYGEMVACDNPDCKVEWFHFACVGLEAKPRGKWYCEDCRSQNSRLKNHLNKT